MAESTVFPSPTAAASGVSPIASAVRQSKRDTDSLTNSAAVWPRILVLFVALVAFKFLLITGQGQSLYEAHWRVGGVRVTWLNMAEFYFFVFLGGLGLFRVGRCCQKVGTRSVRAVNAAVLVLGLSFIFLTFHNGSKNFIYPILSGVLKWSSLGPYLANAVCFNQPFLGVWLFVYAAIYYVLARTGRESWVWLLTVACACSYGLINLRELLVHRNELLIIDCLGAVSLLVDWLSGSRQREEADAVTPPLTSSRQLDGGWNLSRISDFRFRISRSAGLVWLLLPLGWTVFFAWALLRFDADWHTNSASYFLGLLGLTVALFAAACLLVRKLGNPKAWSCYFPFFFVAYLLLINTNYPSSENYNHLLCLALTFPRYFAGELAVVAVLGLGAWLGSRIRTKASLWPLDIGALALIILAGLDLRLSQIMGVRLGWDVVAFGDSPKMMLRMAKPYLPAALGGLVIVVLLYVLAVRALRILSAPSPVGRGSRQAQILSPGDPALEASFSEKMIKARQEPRPTGTGCCAAWSRGFLYVTVAFVPLALVGLATAQSDSAEAQSGLRLVKTSPLWKRVANRTLSPQEFLSTANSLGLGDFTSAPHIAHVQPPRDLNVLVVFMESSYNKHLSLFGSSDETQPLLSKYKERMELFPNFFSAFTGSIHARFATFTSLYPVLDFHAFTQERVPVKSLFEVLHDQGYTCSMFYSSYFDYTGFRSFLKHRGLDEMYDADSMPGQRGTERVQWGLLEEETLGAIRNRLKKYAQGHERFCLTYVPAAPHNPFDKIPKRFQKHKMEEIGDFTPLYLNELLYMDWVIASIVDELKESGLLENTLVVITNDHGEMLGGKEGHIGHGWAVTPELANTPLILMDPGRPGFQLNKTIGSQVDLLPTILDRLNIPIPADQLYEGQSLDAGKDRSGRLAYLNSYKEFAMISGNQVLLGDRERDNPSGIASEGGVYEISNEGAKALFTEASEPALKQDRQAAMARFDAFQETLLRNYAAYCSSIRGAQVATDVRK